MLNQWGGELNGQHPAKSINDKNPALIQGSGPSHLVLDLGDPVVLVLQEAQGALMGQG